MAPRISMQRRQTQSQNEHVYAPGKVGRKTGITIPDNGRRDEHGFEDMDDLFSSPDRELQAETNGRAAFSDDEQDEQDMEIDDGSELGPATTRKLQQGGRPSLPRARSPIKTNLNSPARQNPHMPPTSSPTRGTIVSGRERSPTRKLDFSKSLQNKAMLTNGHAKLNGATGRNKNPAAGRSRSQEQPTLNPVFSEDEEEEEEEQLELLDAGTGSVDDVEEEFHEEPDQAEEEAPVVQELKTTNKSKPSGRRGRKPKESIEKENDEPANSSSANTSVENVEDEEPVRKKKGRPKAAAKQKEPTPPADPTPPPKSSKRGRPARASPENAEEESDDSRGAKRPKTSAKTGKAEQSASSKPAPTKEKAKPGRKRKSSGVGVDSPMIQRGPPLPKSRGLVTLRREDTTTMRTTRSGRASFKPLEWWKGDHVEYDEDQERIFEDAGKRHFKMPTVKGVVRTEENYEAIPRRRGRQPTGRKPGRRPSAVAEEEEIEREDWEYEPGRVTGEVIIWEPIHEFEPPDEEDHVEVFPEQLAISENAIEFKGIKDSTYKFAKTLTLPFFGSGIIDLPPRTYKRPKNSRKYHIAFFVHTGSVRVTIGKTEFAIAKGGMFSVPRGNHYQIQNETDRSARIFFAQGCEMIAQEDEEGEE
ncbi:Mif2/CENP-C like-domain-containing protein [Xylaria curta]|nr:Mif2/CENP-C like-domain-containing protein [Xylaria curta]